MRLISLLLIFLGSQFTHFTRVFPPLIVLSLNFKRKKITVKATNKEISQQKDFEIQN